MKCSPVDTPVVRNLGLKKIKNFGKFSMMSFVQFFQTMWLIKGPSDCETICRPIQSN